MKIQNITTRSQNIQFKTNPYVKQLTMPIADTKVCKNLTELDKNIFRTYIFARKFPFVTTEKEVQELFKFQGEEFLKKAYNFLAEKLDIDKSILPVIKKNNPEDPVAFVYHAKNNLIMVAPNIENFTNIQIFAFLRHELQHFQQNMIMLRDDEIGEKLPKYYAQKIISEDQNNAIALLENSSFEELSKKFPLTPEQAEFYKTCDTYIKNDDIDGFIEIFKPLHDIYTNEWNKVRKFVLEKYGPLNPTEKLRAQAYFEDFSDIQYYNEDGSINLAKHMTTNIEFEANIASEYAIHQMFNKDCYFKTLKFASLQFLNSKNNDEKKLLEDVIEETRKKQEKI